jgi:hypothetical protein
MDEPQNSLRGSGEQQGLTRLTTAFEALAAGQVQQQALLTILGQQHAVLMARVGQLTWAVVGAFGAVVVLVGLVFWLAWNQPSLPHAQALAVLDSVIAHNWSALPKPTQEALSSAYRSVGLPAPPQRQ